MLYSCLEICETSNFYKILQSCRSIALCMFHIFYMYIHIYLLYIFSAAPQIDKRMLIGLYLLEYSAAWRILFEREFP